MTISLAASRDGETLADATADDLDYTIGSGTMLDGLDDAVTGLAAGESATFSSTLVGGARSGEEAEVEVTVSKVQEQELPPADDEAPPSRPRSSTRSMSCGPTSASG